MNDPAKTILAALLGTAGVLTWRGIRTGSLTPRTYASLVVLALLLIMLASFAGPLAAAFAILVLVAVLLSGTRDLEELARFASSRKAP